MDEKTKELLVKIKALADQGIGGEKANAQILLQKKLKLLGLTYKELEDILQTNDILFHEFSYNSKKYSKEINISRFYKVIVSQIYHNRFRKEGVTKLYNYKKKNYYAVEMSLSDFIQYQIQIDLYVNSFIKDLDVFEYSFLLKNNLLSEHKQGDVYLPSASDLEKHENALKMSNGVSYVPVNKMIE